MEGQFKKVQLAERGAKISIINYLVLASLKIGGGYVLAASSLTADGFNNLTDVISSVAVLIGLKTARKPADKDHPYGHWKAEQIASLITSFVMLFVGFQVFQATVARVIEGEMVAPNPTAAIVALISTLVMLVVYRYNSKLAQYVNSSGLKAVAKDNFADAMTSLATAVAIFAASFGLVWLDGLMALIVSIIIFKTGLDIFRESTFLLSDGFHEDELIQYKETLDQLSRVKKVASIKGRMYGTNTYVDVTILVEENMTVQEAHDITEMIERLLYEEHDVMYTDVHVEPETMEDQFSNEQM